MLLTPSAAPSSGGVRKSSPCSLEAVPPVTVTLALRSELAETQRCLRYPAPGGEESQNLHLGLPDISGQLFPVLHWPQRAEWKLWIKEALGFFWVVNCLGWRLTLGKWEKEAEVTRKIS